MSFDFASDEQMLTINDVCKKLSVSRTTLDRWRNSPTPQFPKPTVIIGQSARWSISDLNAWFNERRNKL